MGWDGMGWDRVAMGWDGVAMGWDGMGWDRMGWDRIGSDRAGHGNKPNLKVSRSTIRRLASVARRHIALLPLARGALCARELPPA